MGEGVGVVKGEGVGEGTGGQAAWAWARTSGVGPGRQAYRWLSFFPVGLFFSLYTKIYLTVRLELMKRWVHHGLPSPLASQLSYPAAATTGSLSS